MSLSGAFNLAFSYGSDNKQLSSGGIFSFLGFGNTEGTLATARTAFALSAFYNGVEQISNDIAKLPKSVKKKQDKSRLDFTEHPVNYLIASQPNEMMTAFDFWKVIIVSVIIKGNGYAKIIRNKYTGVVEGLIHLSSDDVKVFRNGNKLYYQYKNEDPMTASEILHFKAFSFDGLIGVSVISFAAKQLGISLDSQNYQQTVYKDRGLGYGVIESDLDVTSPNKKAIEDGFSSKMASQNKFKVPMLDGGMKYKSISVTPAEAQFLETNKAGVLEICRWLNIAPHKLKELANANYSNIQQQSIEHVQDSILPWIVRCEQELNNKLFSVKERGTVFVKFNEKVLLRGDLEARKNYYTALIYAGALTRNEVRSLEDLNPIDGLDEPLQPVNMQALTIANELQQQQIKDKADGSGTK